MRSVDDLVQELRSEGEVVSHGQFTLDREKARDKMRQFQLADPRAYVLELVQAAVLKGATRIDFSIDADDMVMSCDGRLFSAEDFEQLYSSMFIGGDDADLRARRELALGVNAAMALNPRWIRIDSGEAHIELRPGREDRVERGVQSEAKSSYRTRVHVKDRFRPGLVVQFLENVSGRLAEELYLETQCQHARVTVALDGEQISAGLTLAGFFGVVDIAADGIAGVAGFDLGSRDSKLRLIKDGVWITTHLLAVAQPGLCVAIEGEQLRKDVSQANVVDDAAYVRVVNVAKQAVNVAVAALYRQLADLDAEQRPRAEQIIRRTLLASDSWKELRADSHLWEATALPLWIDARGLAKRISLRELAAAAKERGSVRYATEYFPSLEAKRSAPVVFVSAQDAKALKRMFPVVRNVTRTLGNRVKSQENERRFRMRTMAPVLAGKSMLARARIQSSDTVGEVGISSMAATQSHLSLIKDGCLLINRVVELPVGGVEIVVQADFAPTSGFDDVRRDATLAHAVLRVGAALPELAANLARRTRHRHPPMRRLWLLRYLAFAAGSAPGVDLLRAVGFNRKHVGRYVGAEDNRRLRPCLGVGRLMENGPPLDAIAKLGLFSTTRGGVVSPRELQAEIGRHGEIAYVGDSLPAGVETDRALVLRVGQEEWPALVGVFAADTLRNYEDEYRGAMAAAEFMKKPVEGLDLPAGGVTVALDGAGGIRGVVGMYARGMDEDREPRAHVRLLYQHRFLCEHEVEVPFGRVRAVIESDALQPTPEHDGVVRDAALRGVEEVVRGSAGSLAQRFVEAYQGSEPDRRAAVRCLLVEVAAAVLGDGGWDGPPEPEVIRDLPLFATSSGSFASIRDIDAARREHTEVLYLEESPEEQVDDRMILVLDDLDLAALSCVFGPAAFRHGRAWLADRRKRRAFASLPRMEQLAVSRAEALAVVPATVVEGEIGLRNVLAAKTPETVVTVCKDRRVVGEHRFQAPLALVAVVNDDEAAITEEGRLDPNAPSRATIEAACVAQIPALIAQLADAWPELDRPLRRIAWRHILDFLVDYAHRDAEQRSSHLTRVRDQAAAIANFPGADDKLYSLNDLLMAEEAVGEVNFIRSHLRGVPLDARRVVLSPDTYERSCLEQLVRKLVRYDREWSEEQAGHRRRQRAPELVVGVSGDTLVEVRDERRGVDVYLWLPRMWSGDLQVRMGQASKLVEERRISELFPCAGVVRGPSLRVNRAWSEVLLTKSQRAWLEKRAFTLYASLESRLRNKKVPNLDERAAAIAYLGRAVIALHRTLDDSDRKLEKAFCKLYHRLRAQPLLKQPNGRFVSLERALEERPAALDYLELWEPGAEPAPLELPALVEREVPPPPADPAPEPPESNRELTAEERFVAAVCEELRWSRHRDSQVISDHLLSRVRLTDGHRPRVIATVDGDRVDVVRNHPVVEWALASSFDDDRVPLAMVASAVYTAINRALRKVKDEDERRFQAALAQGLVSPATDEH